jgi:hypothetical protein
MAKVWRGAPCQLIGRLIVVMMTDIVWDVVSPRLDGVTSTIRDGEHVVKLRIARAGTARLL